MPPLSVNRAALSGFETQRRCHEKSKTVAQPKRFMFSKIVLKDEISHFNYRSNSKHHDKSALKMIWLLTVSNFFKLKVVPTLPTFVYYENIPLFETSVPSNILFPQLEWKFEYMQFRGFSLTILFAHYGPKLNVCDLASYKLSKLPCRPIFSYFGTYHYLPPFIASKLTVGSNGHTNSVLMRNWTPVSRIPGEHHTARPSR